MAAALTVRPLDPRLELDAFLAVLNEANAMPATAEQWWDEERRALSGEPGFYLVGEVGGRIVAAGSLRGSRVDPERLDVRVVVARAERGRGRGRALAAALDEELGSRTAAVVSAAVLDDDPTSRAWAERRGFAVYDHVFESILDVESFDAARHRSTASIEACEGGDALYELVVALIADVPDVAAPPPPRDRFEGDALNGPDSFTLVVRDGDELVGVTIVRRVAEGRGHTSFTGVRREHRGRGLARALKAAAAEEARRRGWRWLVTRNNARNAAMLAVNAALGYERQAGYLLLRRALR